MHKLYIIALSLCIISIPFIAIQNSYAVGSDIVISQIQLGDSKSATNEFIQIYNNSDIDVEIKNWCLHYASASSIQIGSKLACFEVDDPALHLYVPGKSSVFLISNQLSVVFPELGSDYKFSAALSGTAGHIRLINDSGVEIDKVGWGVTAVSAEGSVPADVPSVGKILSRKTISPGLLQDTDVNKDDFDVVLPDSEYQYGQLYELQDFCVNLDGIQSVVPDGYMLDTVGHCSLTPVDVCLNIDGIQQALPGGYGVDINGDCQIDVCVNIDGLQLVIPDNLELDINGNCEHRDLCPNIDDIQVDIPVGYKFDLNNGCILDLLPIIITEVLPNAVGSDIGNEYIELYNPNDVDIGLGNYMLHIGSTNTKKYSFPIGSFVGAKQYITFSNNDIKFTLLNTTSSVMLYSADGYMIDYIDDYSDPKEGMSWSLIDGIWQYTNQLTPNSLNISSQYDIEIETDDTVDLQPCGPNQYRNPETNRCRNIILSSSTLVPCKDGQYRSEETNRCRNIVSDVVAFTPCAEGQERNPETNRCRSIISTVLGASTLVPCKEGQERNPETNRCRNIVASMPAVQYAPELTNESSNSAVWYVVMIIGFMAVAYAVWEWRSDIAKLFHKIGSFRHSVK